MLVELRVRNLAVVEEIVLEPGPGLNVISGETGAGKSILVLAIELLFGGRADADTIRTGAEVARIEGLFQFEDADFFRRRGIDQDIPDRQLLLVRELQKNGRTRALVNDQMATIGRLKILGEAMADLPAFRKTLTKQWHALDPAEQVQVRRRLTNVEQDLSQLHESGAIFLGPFTPVALGDYAAGPSHVLPTGGTARFSSGLTANDFRKRTSVLRFTRNGLRDISEDVIFLAKKEGLTAHAASVEFRANDSGPAARPKPKPDKVPVVVHSKK